MPSTKRFRSNPGLETSASTAPVPGSIATSAPRRLAEGVLGHALQLHIEREHRRCCRTLRACAKACGCRGRRRRSRPARSRWCRAARARSSPRRRSCRCSRCRGSWRRRLLLLEGRLVGLVDAPHVADDVRADVAERVLAEQPRLDLDAFVAEAVGGELGHLLVGQPRADRQALGLRVSTVEPLEARAVARRDLDQLGELVDRPLDALHAAREDLERVARIVARQDDAVAVEDQAAVRRDRHDRDAVVLGFRAVVVVLHHLQEEEAREQDAEGDEHGHAGDADAQLELLQLALELRSSGGAHHMVCSSRQAALRQEQQPARRRPEQRAGERPDEHGPAGKLVARGEAHQQRDRLRHEQDRADVQRLQTGAEPQDAARQPDAEEGEQRIGEGVLAEQHAVARVGDAGRASRRRPGRPGAAGARTRIRAPARRNPAPGAGRATAGN